MPSCYSLMTQLPPSLLTLLQACQEHYEQLWHAPLCCRMRRDAVDSVVGHGAEVEEGQAVVAASRHLRAVKGWGVDRQGACSHPHACLRLGAQTSLRPESSFLKPYDGKAKALMWFRLRKHITPCALQTVWTFSHSLFLTELHGLETGLELLQRPLPVRLLLSLAQWLWTLPCLLDECLEHLGLPHC